MPKIVNKAILFQHNLQDFLICFPHSIFSDSGYTLYGIFNPFFDNPVSALKLLSVLRKRQRKKCRINGRCNFCRTGRLCTVTDNPGGDSQAIHYRMFNHLIVLMHQIRNSCTCGTACADCSAVRRQPSDSGLLMKSQKIRENQCAI